VLDRVLGDYQGKVRLVFKDFPLPFHALARPAHEAARCAGTFNRYWRYHDRLFEAQPHFSRPELLRYATELGIPADAFARCLDSGQFRNVVEADVEQGRQMGVSATPMFFINGARLAGAHPYEAFKEVIDQALREAGKR